MTIKITTNYAARRVLHGYELTPKEREHLNPEEIEWHRFIRYRGVVYDLSKFERVTMPELEEWDGIRVESFTFGIVIKFVDMDYETVIVGSARS